MNFELHKFKKISENPKSAVLQHPEGHKITIAKNVLSDKIKKQLSDLPMHLAGGSNEPVPGNMGAAEEQSRSQNADFQPQFPDAKPVQAQPNIVINNTPPPQQPQQMAQPQVDQRFNPQLPAPPPAQMAQASTQEVPDQYQFKNDPYGSNAYTNISRQGLEHEKAGIGEAATGQETQNKAIAEENASAAHIQQQQLNTYQDRTSALRAEYQNFVQDYQSKQIDPQHYLNSMGTGQKIATGIGLFLGGIGGAFTHQGNPALEYLNNQIKNDVEAQKMNMDKGKNLMAANMAQFGNERDAANMTEAMQRGIVAHQIETAALNSGNPLIQARAKQAVGQLELQNNQLFSQMAVRQTLQGGQAQGQSQGASQGQIDPATKIRLFGMIGQMTPTQVDEAQKQLQTAENMSRQKDNLLSAFDELDKINTASGRILSPIQTPKQVGVIREPLLAQLVKDAEGRITPTDVEMLRGLFPAPGDNVHTIEIKRNRMNEFVSQKMHFPILDSYGINPSHKNIYGAGGNSKVTEGAPVLPK